MTSASTYSDEAEQPAADPSSIKFSQTPEEVLNLPSRPSPLADENCVLHGKNPAAGQVLVLNDQKALSQVESHSQSNLQSELGGVLLGHVSREGEQVIVDVKAALPAHSQDHGPVHFTFTADAWRQIHKERAELYPNMDIVGWFHTHPALSVFYSSDDVVVHSAAFTLPWHIGLVVDPIRQEAAYFGWFQGEIAPINGFYERLNEHAESVITWEAVPTSVYNISEAEMLESADPTAASDPGQSNMVYLPDNQRLSLSPSSQKLGLIVGGAALVFSLFLLAFWILPLNRQVREIETVVLTLSNLESNPNLAACPDENLRILFPLSGYVARAGSQFDIIGTTGYPEASRYVVEARLVGTGEWLPPLGTPRRDTRLGTLATWNTTESQPGSYEVRLSAVDRNNIKLNQTNCVIGLDLLP